MMENTLFLRMEGPLQAWGAQESKFVIRRTSEAPTKSGVLGLLLAALGKTRQEATQKWVAKINSLAMGVRIDRPGVRWWDYHTVGANMLMRTAEHEDSTKPGAMLTRREYLCDASFLVALQGDPSLIHEIGQALDKPVFTPYLGRKSCPPSRPILGRTANAGTFGNLEQALSSRPWEPRQKQDKSPERLKTILEWRPSPTQSEAPLDALVCYDAPISLEPPVHGPRFVLCKSMDVAPAGHVTVEKQPAQNMTPFPPRTRADYTNGQYRKARSERLAQDNYLCVLCKLPATTTHHVTYERAGGDERHGDLRSLCRLCHDAVTMLEYGFGMGMDRIDPCRPEWRNAILEKRDAIVKYRSLETRRRRLQAEEVE